MKMRNTLTALLGLIIIGASSCQKEVDYVDLGNDPGNPGNPGGPDPGNPSNKSIIGEWQFKKMIVDLQTYVEGSIGGLNQKTVIDIDFTSANEAGTLVIDSSVITNDGIAYTADAAIVMSLYINGALQSQTPMPDQIEQPASSGAVNYTRIGTDSLVADGPLIDLDYTGIPASSLEQRLKVGWLNDTLVLTQGINQSVTDNSGGTPMKLGATGTQTIKLVKK